LRNRGWEVDTETLRHSLGTRPVKGRNMAIAEWPTRNGPADYALFIATRCIAVVEAKRRNKNVSAVLRQAERYSAGFRLGEGVESFGGPWGKGERFVGAAAAIQNIYLRGVYRRACAKILEDHTAILGNLLRGSRCRTDYLFSGMRGRTMR
jgi:type I restriction enzyme R subunit